MTREEFIINVYCLVADALNNVTGGIKLRKRGCNSILTDAEVITMEVVGEFLGIDTDKDIHKYFKVHWLHFFPLIPTRTSFLRQGANLWQVKSQIRDEIFKKIYLAGSGWNVIDGLPMPTCGFRRAPRAKLFQDLAAYGYCASKDKKYYGFKGHALTTIDGVILDFTVAPANIDERQFLLELNVPDHSVLLGDKGYICGETIKDEMVMRGISLQTPLKDNMTDTRPKWLVNQYKNARRIIETTIGQLSERFNIEKIRARDTWHLTARINRKLLGHTIACYFCHINNLPILSFDLLLNN